MIELTRHDGVIVIKGHAEFDTLGKDIVCAAVSTLTQVFIASVDEFTTDRIKADIKPGYVVIQHKGLSDRGTLLLDSFVYGVEMIADQYPKHVRVIKKN